MTNDSGFLTSHQSLSNYSTLANTIKSLSISGKTITYTKGDNTTGTLTTQDNNTWTAMVGATSSSNGSVGYVNAVPPKDGYNTKYLRADGTWQVPPDHTYTVNNATLTIQQNSTTVDTFTANSSSNKTVNIQCVDLTNNQTVGGNKEFTGTTTTHDLVPSATDTYNFGTSTNKWKGINGFDVTGIGHIGSSVMDQSGNVKTYTRINPNAGIYAHYCVAPDNGWVACREHGGSGTFQVCALGSDLNSDPIIISPPLNQYQFGSIPVRKGEYYAIISYNESASYTMRFVYNNG